MNIEQSAEMAGKLGLNMYSLCEYENGKYRSLRLGRSNEKNNIYSVSKSVTSIILGMLENELSIDIEHESVSDIFPAECAACGQSGWEKVMIKHLLTHTTGYSRGTLDIDQDDMSALDGGYLETALAEKLVYRPGEHMIYSDANYYLLSRVIAKKSGRHLQDIALERLFRPMGIYGSAWATCPEGHAMGATGLFLSVEDMAKLGVMLLEGGRYGGRQIVPNNWIERATAVITSPDDSPLGYGYGFWNAKVPGIFWASGMRGQRIIVSHISERVIAWQSSDERRGFDNIVEAFIKDESK